MPKRHVASTTDTNPSKRRRHSQDTDTDTDTDTDDTSEDDTFWETHLYHALCSMCRDNQQESLAEILSQHFAPNTRNVGTDVAAKGGETDCTLPAPLDVCQDVVGRGMTPLMICAERGHVGCLVLLLEAGAGLDVVSPVGMTALLHAAGGSLGCLSELITRGASLVIKDNEGYTALHRAAGSEEDSEAELVHLLLKHGASVEVYNNGGGSPLHMALAAGNKPAVVALLEAGASLAAVDCDGDTALHYAASQNDPQAELVHLLLKQGASVDVVNNREVTPLDMAVQAGIKAGVVALLEAGASLSAVDGDGDTALHTAAFSRFDPQADLMHLLLKHGASVEVYNYRGVSPLHMALQAGNKPAVVALLEAGASLDTVDGDGDTALHDAAVSQNDPQAELVHLLLKQGACVDAANNCGIPPLHVALQAGIKAGVVALLEAGASLSAKDNEGYTALHSAACSQNDPQAELVHLLLKQGASADMVNNREQMPLQTALKAGNKPAAVALLEAGASLAAVDGDGDTALHYAVSRKKDPQAELVHLLLKHGASLEVYNNEGVSPLHMAVKAGNKPAVVALLEAGASLAAVDRDGQTALHYAVSRKKDPQAELVHLLLKHGASVEVVNNKGHTPMRKAMKCHNESGALALLEGGAHMDLHKAVLHGFTLCAEFLLSRGVSASKLSHGRTPIGYAAQGGHVAAGELLLRCGVSVDSTDRGGKTPLMHCSVNGHKDFVAFLLRHGADVEIRDRNGTTALHEAVLSGDAVLCKMLVDHGVPLDAKLICGATALSVSIVELPTNTTVCQALIDAGAQLDVTDSRGYSPLLQACELGRLAYVKMLLDAGAQLVVADNRFTALMLAADGGHVETVRHLLSVGVDVNHQGDNACTALHQAATQKHADVVKLLLKHGADKALRDNDGDTALDCATIGGCPECCQLLH